MSQSSHGPIEAPGTRALAAPEPKGNVDIVVNETSRGMVPRDLAGIWRMAQLYISGRMLPSGIDSPEKVVLVLQRGFELGLQPSQALESTAIINGRVSLWGDAMKALCYASGLLEDDEETIEGDGDARCAVCKVKRRGQAKWHEVRYSVARAKAAGLWGKSGTWKTDPDRMLQMRARAYALRDKFPDVLKGVYAIEEMETAPEEVDRASAASLTRKIESLATPSSGTVAGPADQPPQVPAPSAHGSMTASEAAEIASLLPE